MTHGYAEAAESILGWMEAEGFRGYDPYDGCNTRYRLLTRTKPVRLALTYLNKFSPVNLRPLLGIEKSVNVYGLALVTAGLMRGTPSPENRSLAQRLVREILSRSLVDRYGGHCWSGNGIPIQMRGGYHLPDVPGIIGTEAVTEALLACERVDPDDGELRKVLLSARDFCLEHLLLDGNDGTFFRYKPDTPPHWFTFNASLKAATLVTEVNRRFGSTEGDDAVRRSMDHLLGFQNDDGSWNYSVDLRTGKQRRQIDFHQGFMVDGLLLHQEAYGADAALAAATDSALDFYRNVQFDDAGQCCYRYPQKWPANIHNQAQGIVTFVRAERHRPGSLRFAETIARWTLENMYDGDGRFHYLRYPGFSNRIPYFRWNQAWMYYALTLLAHATEGTSAGHGEPASPVIPGASCTISSIQC